MQPNSRNSLLDILSAAEEILSLVGTHPDRLLTDRLVVLAVERLLLIVGEAAVRIRGSEPAILNHLPDWEAIVGMRNAIVHGYDTIDAQRLRDAVRDDVPRLVAAVRSLLE